MKNLFALFSAKKVKETFTGCRFDELTSDELLKIRGGGEPVGSHEINIIIYD